MYASHFNWLQVSFRRTSLSSTGFESRKGERFPRAQGRRYLPVSASILLYFESLILNPTLRIALRTSPTSPLSRRDLVLWHFATHCIVMARRRFRSKADLPPAAPAFRSGANDPEAANRQRILLWCTTDLVM